MEDELAICKNFHFNVDADADVIDADIFDVVVVVVIVVVIVIVIVVVGIRTHFLKNNRRRVADLTSSLKNTNFGNLKTLGV